MAGQLSGEGNSAAFREFAWLLSISLPAPWWRWENARITRDYALCEQYC